MGEALRQVSAARPAARPHTGRLFGVGIFMGVVLALLACAWALGAQPAAANGATQAARTACTATEVCRRPARAVKIVPDAGPVFMDPATERDSDEFGRVPSVKSQVELWVRGIQGPGPSRLPHRFHRAQGLHVARGRRSW